MSTVHPICGPASMSGSARDGVPFDPRRERERLVGTTNQVRGAAVQVPAGWEPVAAVVDAVLGRLDDVAERVAATIAERIPAYRGGSAVSEEDVLGSIADSLRLLLVGLGERRLPSATDVASRRELAARRAAQGLPVSALIEAYHLGHQVLWDALLEEAPDDRRTSRGLLEAAPLLWRWVSDLTGELAEAYADARRQDEARIVGAGQRFADLLLAGDDSAPEVAQLASAIGVDVGGPFRVTVARAGGLVGTEAREVAVRLSRAPGDHVVVGRGASIVVLSQNGDTDAIETTLHAVVADCRVGVGLERLGVASVSDSFADADQAAMLAEPAATRRFDEVWLWATLTAVAPRLQDVLSHGAATAAAHPHLAAAVSAFADADFSVTETGRRLDLHPNTVAYRLDRWGQVTGWDPRTFEGLARSIAAIRLSGPDPAD
jgi:hypothetical protein